MRGRVGVMIKILKPFALTATLLLLVLTANAAVKSKSKILFLGPSADKYQKCFSKLCSSDLKAKKLNLIIHGYDSKNILEDFYAERKNPTDKNALMKKLDTGYDTIVYIPNDKYQREMPELLMECTRLIQSYTEPMKTETKLVMTWNGNKAQDHTKTFEEHAYRVADALGIECIPVGLACHDLIKKRYLNGASGSVSSPSDDCVYLMATTVYCSLFKNKPSSRYKHGRLSSSSLSRIARYSYSTYTEAQKSKHYKGEYTKGFCQPWKVPYKLGGRNWVSMGTSTEKGTSIKLQDIIVKAGYKDHKGHIINGYKVQDKKDSATRFFSLNLFNPVVQKEVTEKDFQFVFSRLITDITYPEHMKRFDKYDPGKDGISVVYARHYSRDAAKTLQLTASTSEWMVRVARSHERVHSLPTYIGLGRAWNERPDLILIPKNNIHLSNLGTYMQAGMVFTLVTGQNAAEVSDQWTDDQKYVLNLAYQTVTELGYLKRVKE